MYPSFPTIETRVCGEKKKKEKKNGIKCAFWLEVHWNQVTYCSTFLGSLTHKSRALSSSESNDRAAWLILLHCFAITILNQETRPGPAPGETCLFHFVCPLKDVWRNLFETPSITLTPLQSLKPRTILITQNQNARRTEHTATRKECRTVQALHLCVSPCSILLVHNHIMSCLFDFISITFITESLLII